MRLIDADALAKFIDYGHLNNPDEKLYSENDIREMIDMMPTMDTVPDPDDYWLPGRKKRRMTEAEDLTLNDEVQLIQYEDGDILLSTTEIYTWLTHPKEVEQLIGWLLMAYRYMLGTLFSSRNNNCIANFILPGNVKGKTNETD